MPYETVLLERMPGERIAVLSLNRPAVRNAINRQLGLDLEHAIAEVRADAAIGALVLTGVGAGFSAGGDLKDFGIDPYNAVDMYGFMQGVHRMMLSLVELEKPVVAAVNGDAMGAGWSLALAADLVIASAQARFGQAFMRIGAIPDLGSAYFLAHLVGLHRAKELILLGDPITADQARHMGLVNRVVQPQEVLPAATQMAIRLARGPQPAMGHAKQMLLRVLEMGLRSALQQEAGLQSITFQSADFHEGRIAFLEKREPQFGGGQ